MKPGFSPNNLARRADPTLSNFVSLAEVTSFDSPQLVKRTDPVLLDTKEEYGENWDGESKKEWLEGAFKDVYKLVYNALNNWNDDIFDRWFPPRDKDNVQAAFNAIIKDKVSFLCSTYIAKLC